MSQAGAGLPMNRLLRRWVLLPLKIPTITTTVFQLLDLGHGQEDRRWLETNHPGMWVLRQKRRLRHGCDIRENQLPTVSVSAGAKLWRSVCYVHVKRSRYDGLSGPTPPAKNCHRQFRGAGCWVQLEGMLCPCSSRERKERPSL